VTQRIGGQVDQNLTHSQRVDFGQGYVAGSGGVGLRPAAPGLSAEGGDHLADQDPQVGWLPVQLQHAPLGQRQRAQVVDRAREQPGLLQQRAQKIGVGRESSRAGFRPDLRSR
jgi:hypothetical protein